VRQQLLQRLATVVPRLPLSDWASLAERSRRFLNANYDIAPAAISARVLFATRYRDMVRDMLADMRSVAGLLRESERVLQHIDALRDDAVFADGVAAIEAAVQDPVAETLQRAVARDAGVEMLGCDHLLRERASPFRGRLEALIEAVWMVDAFCSMAVASARTPGVLPHVTDGANAGGALALRGLRHPLLPDGVANDVCLASDERVLFLTGPNMAGKSTVLRAMGIAVHCAHLGMRVCADFAVVPRVDAVVASMAVRDNLARAESLYLAEVRRVKRMVEAVHRGAVLFAIFDEVFRGTNVHDAREACALLVSGLAAVPSGTFVLASHLAEVGREHLGARGVACQYLEAELRGGNAAVQLSSAAGGVGCAIGHVAVGR
jgi:DNA mismatch repair protein MutS